MCTFKRLYIITLVSLLVTQAYGKKKWPKRPSNDEDETTPQPNVVTYSNFGFNDVGPKYDGFIPSSPDYANYLSNHNQETSTRLYAPAFPTAMDNNGYNNYPQGQESQNSFTSTGSENGAEQPGVVYDSNPYNNFAMPMESETNQNGREDSYNNHNDDFYNAPVYGTKLGAKNNKNRYISPSYQSNSSTGYGNSGYNTGDDKFTNFNEVQPLTQDTKPVPGESASSSHSFFNTFPQTFHSHSNGEDEVKSPSNTAISTVKFSKVVDFTKFKPSYPTELNNNMYSPENMKHVNEYNNQNENSFMNSYFNNEHEQNPKIKYNKDHYEDEAEKPIPVPIGTNVMEFSVNHIDNSNKNNKLVKPFAGYKMKKKPNDSEQPNFFGSWKNSMNDDYFNETKTAVYRPPKTHMDEASGPSNSMDYSKYSFPGTDMTNHKVKKLHDYKQEASDNYPSIQQLKYQENLVQNDNEYYNQLKNLYSTTPSISSQWGNAFKGSENLSYRSRPKAPQAQASEDDVVHIPKRQRYHIKQQRGKSEWHSNVRHGPYKGKISNEWNKDVPNRFKSEEDLLGLRNHDTSHPQYLPNYKLSDPGEEFKNYMSENDYKNLVEKWRQSYMKSKLFKDHSAYKDNDAYGSDTRPMHVPVPKPYPIEVPHPVIVPVPQPYPVRVPVPKPVAVPVIREITVPIEKPVPYPVIKKVPYPVEKLVPVPVEKEVQVPVMKPYAVPVPHVRPVFHHSRPSHDELDSERDEHDEFDYLPHASENTYRGKKYMKSVKGSNYRLRSRRPSSHSTYYERNRRRWPSRRPASTYRAEPTRSRRPLDHSYAPRHKYSSISSFRDTEFEDEPLHHHNDY